MGDESEKRFDSIMDKLFHSPKPKPKPTSKSNSSSSRGKNPLNLTSALTVMDSNSRADVLRYQSSTIADKSLHLAPLCRPWDRGDLLKRLATFKAMTWFGKPKVVSAINCARRGWINVDMDIIACESCGARLLFSNPSSWTQQQVMKAALVFSLKLDSGHKLLCPWIDNACDEKLAQFPPMPAPVLVEGYRERSSALLQLLALPIISSSAIDKMRSPQLEQFIRQSLTLECGDGSTDTFRPTYLGNECEAVSANLYYQALKLISLCGWEPRSLPYMVDCKNLSNQSAKDATHLKPSHITTNGQDLHVYSASMNGIMESNEFTKAEGGLQSDPHSVVLDCKLCGATVGLWAFSTVPRPVELFRLVGYSEVGAENDSEATSTSQIHLSNENRGDSSQGVLNASPNDATSSKDRSSTLNMTIAGGPPPTKQNFKASISLPIIGQNLRARFSSDFNFRDRGCVNIQSDSVSKNTFQMGKDHTEPEVDTHNGQVQAEGTGMLKRKRHGDGHCDSESDDQLTYSNNDVTIQDCTLTKEIDSQMSLDDRNVTGEGLFHETGTHDSLMNTAVEGIQNIAHESDQSHNFSQNEEVVAVDPTVGGSEECLVTDTFMETPGAEFIVRNGETTENYLSMTLALQPLPVDNIIHHEEISLPSHPESSCDASSMEASLNLDNTSKIDIREGNYIVHNTSRTQTNSLETDVIEDGVQTSVHNGMASDRAKDFKQPPLHKQMEFDAIRQHRHFCPWISSTGSAAPGWQQTLSAIQRQKESSHPLHTESPSSASTIEVDDPIASIRKLFMSPLAKRLKSTHNPG